MELTKKYLAAKYKCSIYLVRTITSRSEFEQYRIGNISHYLLKNTTGMHELFKKFLKIQLAKSYKKVC